jgi:hypothetical protein
VQGSIKQVVMRTLGTGLLLMATIPPAAVVLSRPPAQKSITLRMTFLPADGNTVSAPTGSASR